MNDGLLNGRDRDAGVGLYLESAIGPGDDLWSDRVSPLGLAISSFLVSCRACAHQTSRGAGLYACLSSDPCLLICSAALLGLHHLPYPYLWRYLYRLYRLDDVYPSNDLCVWTDRVLSSDLSSSRMRLHAAFDMAPERPHGREQIVQVPLTHP